MAIPKVIHQVWDGETNSFMSIRLQILARTWREQNPDWEYHLWNREEMEKLVETCFPKYLSIYKSFPHNVQRWDTIRYMILYVYGGVYTDLDTECFKSLNPLFENVTMGFGEEPPEHNPHPGLSTLVGNAFMFSEQGCEGWLDVLKEISAAIERNYVFQTVMNTTGPLMVSRIFDSLQKQYGACSLSYKNVTPLTKNDMYNYVYLRETEKFKAKTKAAYCAHYFFGSWNAALSLF